MIEMFRKWKEKVVELVRWVERELPGKTGKEKKQLVLRELNRWLGWPFPFNLVVNIVTSKLIDATVEKLNWLVDHDDWSAIAATAAEIVPVLGVAVAGEAKAELSVDQRLRELYFKYGIVPSEEVVERSMEGNYFTDAEFACKCGCGANKVNGQLRDTLNVIRRHLNVPVTISSGTRCQKRNSEVSKSTHSRHLTGEAADITAKDIAPDQVWQEIKALHARGELPHLGGLGRYDRHTHVDVRPGALIEWDDRTVK